RQGPNASRRGQRFAEQVAGGARGCPRAGAQVREEGRVGEAVALGRGRPALFHLGGALCFGPRETAGLPGGIAEASRAAAVSAQDEQPRELRADPGTLKTASHPPRRRLHFERRPVSDHPESPTPGPGAPPAPSPRSFPPPAAAGPSDDPGTLPLTGSGTTLRTPAGAPAIPGYTIEI